MDDALARLARAYGIAPSYHAIDGTPMQAPDEAVVALLGSLGVSAGTADERDRALGALPPAPDGELGAPDDARCYVPGFLDQGGAWGVSCQLYGLRSRRNWGIGDFEDLARLGETLAGLGADFVGVNPLHALFLAAPDRASPFSPADRSFLNPLYIAVDQVAGFDPAQDVDDKALAGPRAAALVDYPAVAEAKLAALRRIHARSTDRDSKAFRRFVAEGGTALERHGLFQAIGLTMVREGRDAGWMSWPAELQEPDGTAVAAFSRANAKEVAFQLWLQWIADRQLGAAAARLKAAGMRIGLYLDLAVGTAPDGSATWSDRALTVIGAEIGAPPDMFNPNGQKWGLAPVSPAAVVSRELEPVRRAYDAVLRHAGALRIDHAMSVHRLFWVPWGRPASDGAYVLYPMAGIVRILAQCSQRHGSIIIGEDLGVVPDGFRDAMDRAGMLGYRLFFFERANGGFLPPEHWMRNALACVGSHDTATLAGWWTGSDIATRRNIGFYNGETTERLGEERRHERRQAAELLRSRGMPVDEDRFDEDVAAAVHRLVARAPSRLFAAQLEDLIGEVEQPNLPGTVDEHPNWRRRIAVPIEELGDHAMLRAVTSAVAAERPR